MPFYRIPNDNYPWHLTPSQVASGVALPDGAVEITNDEAYLIITPPPSIDKVKAEKLAQLQQARDQAASANVTVQGKTFSAEPNIQTAFKRLADRMRRGKPSALAAIFEVDGTPVPTDAVLLEKIEDAIADQTEAAWNKYGTLVGQVQAATTYSQVEAIVW